MSYVISDGTILERSTDGTTYATVPQTTNIVPPRIDPQYASTRNLASGGAETMGWTGYSTQDGSAEIVIDPADTVHAAMLVDSKDGTNPASRYWRVTYAVGSAPVTWRGIAIFVPTAAVGEWIKGTLTLKCLDPTTLA